MAKADGSVVMQVNMDVSDADKELARLKQKITRLQEAASVKGYKRDALTEQLAQMKAEYAELQKLNTMDAKGNFVNPKLEEYTALGSKIREAEVEIAQMDRAIAKTNLDLQAEQTYYGDVAVKAVHAMDAAREQALATARAKGALEGQANAAVESAAGEYEAASAADRLADAAGLAEKKMGKFANRVKSLAKRVFVLSLISSALRGMKDWFGKVIKTNSEATAAIAKLKGALLTLVQPLVEVVIPAFTTFVNLLTRVVSTVASLMAKLFGTTVEAAAESAQSLYEEQEALDGVGGSAKDAGESLAGFDEINTISDGSEGSGGSTAPDFSSVVGGGLSEIVQLFSGMALVALGAILIFTGAHILLGMALVVAGALMVYDAVSSNPGAVLELLRGGLGTALTAIGPFLAVVGVVLMLMGHLLLGIGLVVAGIALFSVGEASKSENFEEALVQTLNETASGLGKVIAVIGVALVCFGHMALGIGMIVAGAALFAVGEADLNDGTLSEKITSILAKTLEIVGTLIVVIGIFFLCVGQIPFGVGMIIAGIAALGVSAVAENWNLFSTDLVKALSNTLGKIAPYLAIIGVLFLFVPALMPVGIGLIVAGLAAFAFSKIAPNWDAILDSVKEAWEKLKSWWNRVVAPVFTAKFWKDLGQNAINNLLNGLKNAWKNITSWVTEKISWIANKFKGIFGGDTSTSAFSGAQTGGGRAALQSASIQLSDVPALARGSVIPKNREFLAVLGDNKQETEVVSPVSTIKQAVLDALRESGGSGQTMEVKLYLDGKQIARNQVKHINDMTQAAGKPVLLF